MNKPITKGLFVDYCEFKKLARWKVNNIDIYKKIRKIESQEQEEQIVNIGQTVENLVKKFFEKKYNTKTIDLMPPIIQDNQKSDIENDNEKEDFVYFPKNGVEPRNVIINNIIATIQAIKNKEKIIYQPGFMIDGIDNISAKCFVRADFMILQDNGKYDIIEVKAKSAIRKEVSLEGQKYKVGNIEDRFINDVSFQKWVINKSLNKEGLPTIGDVYIYYLNKDYIKNGDIELEKLVAYDMVGTTSSVTINGNEKDKIVDRIDNFVNSKTIEQIVEEMHKHLSLDEKEFNKINLFPGNKYLSYFGKKAEFGTVCAIPKMNHNKAPIVQNLYYKNKINLIDLTDEERDLFNSNDGWGSVREFIERYIYCTKTGNKIINKDAIKKIISEFRYPICFYDYETISTPIPFFDYSYPYQQIPVQYSLHKYYENGQMEHFGGLLILQGDKDNKSINQFIIPNNKNKVNKESEKIIIGSYKDLLEEFIYDIGEDINNSTFIVWYKPFENTRNKEISKIFIDLEQKFTQINNNTYDLMEIFSKNHYFDLGFQGSNSIKKVLPILVPQMSYDDMKIGNGAIAMQKLEKLINNEIFDPKDRNQTIENLLRYCGQDSIAMVKIFNFLAKII